MIDRTELQLRQAKIREEMRRQGIDAALIACNVNLLYTLGAIVNGYVYLPVDAPAQLFIKRPNTLSGEHVHPIRKPEQMIDILVEKRIPLPKKLMIEGDLPHTEYMRLSALFSAQIVDASPVIKRARAVKTNYEIELFRRSGLAHTRAYEQIPAVFRKGMTDLDLSIEIERLMRREGCLGIFRVGGQSMEIFMGSLLVGDNAAVPSPYDFALGGAGADASLPVGANGTTIREGQSMMVDYGGNFFGYICDMTRVFSAGRLPQRAYDAHQVCLEVQANITDRAKPGVLCETLYDIAIQTVTRAGFADYFMGIGQKARFVGHGIGLEINEPPVLAPRNSQPLEAGMVFALEPKIVLPETGAVGIENSWVVASDGIEKLTPCKEEIVNLY